MLATPSLKLACTCIAMLTGAGVSPGPVAAAVVAPGSAAVPAPGRVHAEAVAAATPSRST